jgi:mannitol/fructose-specific phosphotransferase system IIA component (Ntr-type)
VNPPTALIAQPDTVMSGLRAADAEEAIRLVHVQLCAATPAVKNPPELLKALVERARLSSVCIAPEIALPHARTDAVERMVLAVAGAPEGIAFDAEHPAIRLVFLIGTPRQAVAEYLQMVATLSRWLKTPGIREALLAARTEPEMKAVLSRAAVPKP